MSFLSATPPRPLRRAASETGRSGVLLVNLGTPDSTRYWDVRRYLSEFLSDRRVIEINPLLWQPLLQGVILTTRPFRSGAAYRRIWNTALDESPLRSFTRSQAEKLQHAFPEDGPLIDWAMRYGRPSIAEKLEAMQDQGCDRILVVPLYPQYSATTTATVNDQVFRALMRMRRQPTIRIAPPFPDHPLYIEGLAKSVRETLATLPQAPQLLVASFHGLPRRYVKAGDPYPAECNRTMRALRASLGLTARDFPMTFQSRFGREPWLEPYTDERITSLPKRGITRVAVITPGFLSDCIETLDEIGHELREEFLEAGGETLTVIPCLNDTPDAIRLLRALVRDNMF
ncbi:ferrochelatase [Pseudoroseomonas cervicalis]|uniref:ferrochelatase n=1 Tax=Teichococcus cervicalis TaxID=204525 RepID=UPI00277D2053|nr:ferrochelatase [Pseudoroseomonas cervicalis]MDQ1077710.1 ferrochelatase [Pseudoroseomonas cervicalis]